MKRLFGIALVGMFLFGVFYNPALAGSNMVNVMTRNQYLGADLTPVILAKTEDEFLEAATDALTTIAANNFPLRAQRLAKEVALTKPDLISLQEVYDFKLNDENFGPPFVDHLTVTLDALAARGQRYVVAATVVNLDITIPFGIDEDGVQNEISVVDRDVILVREGVHFTPLSGNLGFGGLCGVPVLNPAYGLIGPEFFQSTSSKDGCNYTIVAQVNSPVGLITIERGFVGVDAIVRGKKYRFVNTHLEERQPDPDDPNSAIIQYLQSVELVGTLQATTPSDRMLILLGDFNSSPEDMAFGPIIPPYQFIVGNEDFAFADAWNKNPLALFNPEGLTCCESEDLSNTRSDHYERIDIIFVRDLSFLPLAVVTGQLPIFPLSQPPNWASDHGGVFGKLFFKRGR